MTRDLTVREEATPPHMGGPGYSRRSFLRNGVAMVVGMTAFVAALHGLSIDAYYDLLCELADSLPGPGAPEITPEVAMLLEPPSPGPSSPPGAGGCGSGSCGCG